LNDSTHEKKRKEGFMVSMNQMAIALACGVFSLFSSTIEGHTCAGTMDHRIGDFPVTYEFDSAEECAASYVGYVKYWGPETKAWTEGTYTWDCYGDQAIKILIMKFAEETNTCKSFDYHIYT
jgi:hypothetical protein